MSRMLSRAPAAAPADDSPRERSVRAIAAGVAVGLVAGAVLAAASMQLTHGDGSALGLAAALLRFVRYLGALVAAGSLAFLAVVRPDGEVPARRARRLALASATAAAAATAGSVPLQAAYLADDMGRAVDPATLRAVLDSGFGQSVGVGLLGLALLAAAAASARAFWPGLAAAGALLALGSFLLTGHTVTSQPQAVVLPANLAHTAAAAVWLGGLCLLPGVLADRRRADDAPGGARAVARFSGVAAVALAVVAVAGGALAWVEVRSVAALSTPYGAVLTAKVAIVVVVAALGAYNNRRLVPLVREAGGAGWDRLSRIVRLETAGLVGVLAVTAVLVNITPARIDAGIDTEVARIAAFGGAHTATVVVDPAQPGSNEVHIYIEHDQRALGQVATDVVVSFVPPGQEAAVAQVEPAQVGPGHWLHLGSEMSAAGEWRVRVAGTVADEAHEVTVTVPVVGTEAWEVP